MRRLVAMVALVALLGGCGVVPESPAPSGLGSGGVVSSGDARGGPVEWAVMHERCRITPRETFMVSWADVGGRHPVDQLYTPCDEIRAALAQTHAELGDRLTYMAINWAETGPLPELTDLRYASLTVVYTQENHHSVGVPEEIVFDFRGGRVLYSHRLRVTVSPEAADTVEFTPERQAALLEVLNGYLRGWAEDYPVPLGPVDATSPPFTDLIVTLTLADYTLYRYSFTDARGAAPPGYMEFIAAVWSVIE